MENKKVEFENKMKAEFNDLMYGAVELEYASAIAKAKAELKIGVEEGKSTYMDWINDPIYPTNFELYLEFCTINVGFMLDEFLMFLNRDMYLEIEF